MDDVDAGFLDAADVEGVGVDELHDDDAENVFVGERLRGGDLGGDRPGRFRRAARWRDSRGGCLYVGGGGFGIGDPDFGEAAEKFAEGAGAAAGGMVGGEKFEEVGADGVVLFVEDGVGGAVDQNFGRDHAGERGDLAV